MEAEVPSWIVRKGSGLLLRSRSGLPPICPAAPFPAALTATQTLWGALGEDALASFDHTDLATNLDGKGLFNESLFDGIFPIFFSLIGFQSREITE